MMEQCVISVIIPVYKAEKYLSRCIASLLAQSFTAFELLLIDDGSPDNSGKICHDWAERDCRIRVLHQTNAGVSAARNKGLDEAKGEYIVFVDSDDYVGTDYLKHLYEERPLNLDSIVVQGFTIVSEQADRQYTTSFIPSVYTGREVRELFLNDEMRDMRGPVAKLFSRVLIERLGLRFPAEASFGEDTIFNFQYLFHCRQVVVGSHVDYVYCDVPGSLTKRLNDFASEYATFKLYKSITVRLAGKLDLNVADMRTAFSFVVLFFQRALIADYRSAGKVPFSLRTQHLRRLAAEQRSFMKEFYHPGYKADKWGRQFLLHGFCFCYNLYMSILCSCRFRYVFGYSEKA